MRAEDIARSVRFNPCFRGSSSGRADSSAHFLLKAGFNPCFRGSSSGRFSGTFRLSSIVLVSILVFVEVALEVNHSYAVSRKLRFQSLFSWK